MKQRYFNEHIRKLITVGMLFLTFIYMNRSYADKNIVEPNIYLTVEPEKKTVFEGEGIKLSFYLHTSEPRIGYANRMSNVTLDKGEFKHFSRLAVDNHGQTEILKSGKKGYIFPLETLYVSLPEKGEYTLKGGIYEIGVEYPVVYKDPFWGLTRTTKIEKMSVEVPPLKLKVKPLPSDKSGEGFSGAIGKFSIKADLPPGNITIGETGIMEIRIVGKGLLDDEILPDYSHTFGSGVMLKSISENKSQYLRNGEVISDLRLECEFVAKEKDAEIGPIYLKFFNPQTGRYETEATLPIKIEAKSRLHKLPTTDI